MPDVTPESVIELAREVWPDNDLLLECGEIKVEGDRVIKQYPSIWVAGSSFGSCYEQVFVAPTLAELCEKLKAKREGREDG